MNGPFLKRYRVVFWQENHCSIEVPATSEAHAIAFVEGALARGPNLGANTYAGDYGVDSADEVPGLAT